MPFILNRVMLLIPLDILFEPALDVQVVAERKEKVLDLLAISGHIRTE